MFSFQNLLYGGFGSVEYRALYIAAEWLSAAGHLLFAYAVLRDKVVDPGFVVNRAVVYGIISALLLVVFGLVEWGVEHVIPLESREKSALVDAAIALVIYLIFHRIKDSVERFIEKVLFHKWHHNEAALRRFVKEADFINDPDALLKAFVAELTRFAQGAGSAIYLQRHADSFDLAHGEDMAGLRIDDNAPFVVALRARHSAVEPEDHATAMALPLSHRGTLFGFAVLAAKPDGGSYRPDETEVLAWAAHQIGLDFHALKVEALESEAATLRQQNVTLASVITGALSKAPA